MTDIRSVHFVCICGTAMASVAAAMQEKCFRVTGSDQNKELFIRGRRSLVVTGTHGKRTTTSLLTWVFDDNG